jgi:hypothetical protein
MALNDAIKVLSEIKKNPAFRESLYLCDSADNLQVYIKSLGYNFTIDELEDSYRSLLLKCQYQEDADLLTEVYNMYRILIGMNPVFTP